MQKAIVRHNLAIAGEVRVFAKTKIDSSDDRFRRDRKVVDRVLKVEMIAITSSMLELDRLVIIDSSTNLIESWSGFRGQEKR